MYLRSKVGWLALGLGVAASGCFTIDDNLLRDDDASASIDPVQAPDASSTDDPDNPDSASYPLDGSAPTTPDASAPDAAPPEPQCAIDSDCSGDQICNHAKQCVARCSSDGCFGPMLESRPYGLLSDGQKVFYMQAEFNSFGEPANPGLLVSWDLHGTPQIIARLPEVRAAQGFFMPVVIEGPYLYASGIDALWRFPLAGGTAELVDSVGTDIRAPGFSGDSIWWSKMIHGSDSRYELWRASVSDLSVRERVATSKAPWIFGPNAAYSYTNPGTTRLAYADRSTTTLSACPLYSIDEDSAFYCTSSGFQSNLWRQRDEGRGLSQDLSPRGEPTRNHLAFRQGDWVYWTATRGTSSKSETLAIGRTHKNVIAPPETLVEWPATNDFDYAHLTTYNKPAAALGSLVRVIPQEARLVITPLLAYPCAAELPCAAGTTCGADNRCH